MCVQVQDITVNHQQLINLNTGKTIKKKDPPVLHGYENKYEDQYKGTSADPARKAGPEADKPEANKPKHALKK